MSRFGTTPWSLIYQQWEPEEQPLREALCALGNGNFVTRGAAEEATTGACHYPGTYLAGGYNRLESQIAQRIIENEDLINWPNWLCLRFRPVGGGCLSLRPAQSEVSLQARKLVSRAADFSKLLAQHSLTWSHLWKRCDVVLRNGPQTQFVLRFHVFHLLQPTSHNTVDRDVGIPARGWHGEAYRGHIFWDELFVFAFFNLRLPEMTRELLMYRYRRLDEARHAASDAGFRGAMYPWQSGSDGREESQIVHLNPDSGRWVPDETHLQRHVNSAIPYNVWQYYEGTGDQEFLVQCGAEIILEIARFWASVATLNTERSRYEIRGVVGPDEFHTRYPWRDAPGLDNNAYTNVMAAWVLRRALDVLDLVGEERSAELLESLQLNDEELALWEDISQRMYVPMHAQGPAHDSQIISQFEAYEKLEEFDWEGYRQKHGETPRLDRILEAEGDTANRYQVSKQADVLMLFFLFSADELQQLFQRLGYDCDTEIISRTVRFYSDRASHGSTLSRVVHAWVLSRSDRDHSCSLFRDALESDIPDIQGGTTSEGIHLGAMAGTVDLVQRCYAGIETRDNILWINPHLPTELAGLRFRIRYRRHWVLLDIDHQRVQVTCERGCNETIDIRVLGKPHAICQDNSLVVPLPQAAAE